MFCYKCGTQNISEATKCGRCGNDLLLQRKKKNGVKEILFLFILMLIFMLSMPYVEKLFYQ